jgi:hypothetical protein
MMDKKETASKKPPAHAAKPQADHFNQPVKRRADFIKPVDSLRAKVGYGGLSENILDKAQALIENSTVDFQPMAELYLDTMMRGIEIAGRAENRDEREVAIGRIINSTMQLKANGGMFRYPLVTRISDKLIQFLEVIAVPDKDAVEIMMAYYTTIRAVLMARITGTGGKHGEDLLNALDAACLRYFTR